MSNDPTDVQALAKAFELFTQTTRSLEESYHRLEARLQELDKELEEKNRELALANDYLSYILESMSDGVIAINTDGNVTRFNRAASQVLGYSADEVVNKPFDAVFGRAFAAPQGRHLMELRTKDGVMAPVSERDAPIADRAGQRIGWVKVFQDLTEVELLREQIRQKDRLAAVGELAATVAHEIRNPLGGIRGFATLLEKDLSEGDPRRRLVEKILAGARNLDDVVTELLEYTRPLQLKLAPVEAGALAQSALSFLQTGEKQIDFVQELSEDLRLFVDPDKMRQVLLNILLNAVQSISSHGVVRITAKTDGDNGVLTVTDTGRGMNADELSQAFSPFYTTKEKGTGLGLAVAEKIVEGHGGYLHAESQPNAGTSFSIVVPRAFER